LAHNPEDDIARPKKFTEEQCSLIIETALCLPDLLGEPHRRWSLPRLRDFLAREKIVDTEGRRPSLASCNSAPID